MYDFTYHRPGSLAEAGQILSSAEEGTLLAGGHTHVQMLRQHRGMLLVNAGSVGAPFREVFDGTRPTVLKHAEYAIVEVDGEEALAVGGDVVV